MYEVLKEIIKTEAILKNYNSSKNSFYITENDKLAKCKRVDLLGFEDENTTVCFELDCKKIRYQSKHKLSPYFNDGIDLDKGNDAIIFTRIEGVDYIFISELKDDSKSSEIIKQLKSSTCFIDYLRSILKNIYNIKNTEQIVIKYLVFSMSGNNLRPTGATRRKAIEKDGLSIYFSNCCDNHNIKSFI